MFSEKCDIEAFTTENRRIRAEALANHIAFTQEVAKISRLTVYENVDTGEISYGTPPSGGGQSVATTATETVASNSPFSSAADPDAGARHVKIAISFVLVVILTWAWFLQRKAGLQAARQSGG